MLLAVRQVNSAIRDKFPGLILSPRVRLKAAGGEKNVRQACSLSNDSAPLSILLAGSLAFFFVAAEQRSKQ